MKIKLAHLGFLLLAILMTGCSTEQTLTATPTVGTIAPTATTLVAEPTATTTAVMTAPTATEAIAAATATTATTTEPTATEAMAAATATTATTGDATPTVAATGAITATGTDTTPKVVAAATAFLATLSATERSAVLFDWSNSAQKARWSNLPQGLYTRAGLMWGNMTAASQQAWLAVMQATLSTEGYNRVLAEWNADDVLAAQQGSGGQLQFGKQYYWIAIIGTPSETSPWQWQWGGHHVTINATVSGTSIALTPSFIGAQPATYTDSAGNTVRPLGDIEDAAFALVNSLDSAEQSKAILGSTAIDLVLGPGQDGKTIQSEGLPASAMTADQQAMFLALIKKYTHLINDEDAALRDADIQSHLADTTFAWYGPTTAGSAIYFRITGPSIVVEYSPQQMGGNAANHIHGIYRDPTNDYGAGIISK